MYVNFGGGPFSLFIFTSSADFVLFSLIYRFVLFSVRISYIYVMGFPATFFFVFING